MKKIIAIAGVCVFVVILAFVVLSKGRKDSFSDGADGGNGISASKLFSEANTYKKNGDWLKAKESYQKIMMDFPDFDQMETVQNDIGDINIKIFFSNVATPKTMVHEVAMGDTLGKIASKYHTTTEFIKRSNNLKNDVIRAGQKLRIYNASFNIFVDKSQNVLMLRDGDEVVKVYHVSTGKDNSTPVGKFKVMTKLVDPVWFNKGAVVPPESPANVLGSRWLGFDLQGYGIHGTVEPDLIGQQVTAGCVRMQNSDVEELYSLVPTGIEVTIVD